MKRLVCLALLALVLVGCDINNVDLGIKVSERMECTWSKRHLVCVCVYQHAYSGFMAIAPDQVCLGPADEEHL